MRKIIIIFGYFIFYTIQVNSRDFGTESGNVRWNKSSNNLEAFILDESEMLLSKNQWLQLLNEQECLALLKWQEAHPKQVEQLLNLEIFALPTISGNGKSIYLPLSENINEEITTNRLFVDKQYFSPNSLCNDIKYVNEFLLPLSF